MIIFVIIIVIIIIIIIIIIICINKYFVYFDYFFQQNPSKLFKLQSLNLFLLDLRKKQKKKNNLFSNSTRIIWCTVGFSLFLYPINRETGIIFAAMIEKRATVINTRFGLFFLFVNEHAHECICTQRRLRSACESA